MATAAMSGLVLLRPEWPAPAGVHALATTRIGGASVGAWSSLNLGDHVGDDPAAVAENRRRLVQSAGLPEPPRWLVQVHGTVVADAATAAPRPQADAMVSRLPGMVCAVLSADCLPVLFCDRRGSCVAAAHAGWRGLAAGVLEATVAALVAGGARAAELMAWIGPAIGAAAYEVGDEVRDTFLAADPGARTGFHPNARGRWQLDLPAIARQRLAATGVQRVFGGHWCTHGDPARFFSHRRDGRCGRQAALVWLADGPAG